MTLLWLLLALQILITAGTTYDIWLRHRIIAAQDEYIAMTEDHIKRHTRLEQLLDIDQVNR